MEIPESHSEVKKYDISEPILFEYNYRLPVPLRIGAAFILLALIVVPIALMILNEQLRSNLPDNFIFIFILVPALFNFIFYKRTYIFTERGIYILGKQKGKTAGDGSPMLLMEWGDYDRFKRTLLGFKIFNRVKVEEYSHTDIQQGIARIKAKWSIS
jgi:hypothetical protein